jgi:hypothetical protein
VEDEGEREAGKQKKLQGPLPFGFFFRKKKWRLSLAHRGPLVLGGGGECREEVIVFAEDGELRSSI